MSLPENNEFTKKPEESQFLDSELDDKIQISDLISPVSLSFVSDVSQIESLDTQIFTFPSIAEQEKIIPTRKKALVDKSISDTASQSTNVGKFRKFKGHRNIEVLEENESSSENRLYYKVDSSKERLKSEDSEEQKILSISQNEISKVEADIEEDEIKSEIEQKAYSPNRSFLDLLNENERRENINSKAGPESKWNEESRGIKNGPLIKRTNYRVFILSGLIAFAIGIIMTIFYINSNGSKETDLPEISQNNGNLTILEEHKEGISSNMELRNKVIIFFKEYYETTDKNKRASLCRVPNRTLKDMNTIKSNKWQSYKVIDAEIANAAFKKGKVKFIQVEVKLELDGNEYEKFAYVSEDSAGTLKLDWHSYEVFEPLPWNIYIDSKDKNPMFWHLIIDNVGDLHPDFPENKFEAIKVRSWNSNSYGIANAILRREDPMYQKCVAAIQTGQRTFIFKVHHLGDLANTLIIDEIISLSEFYEGDIDAVIE